MKDHNCMKAIDLMSGGVDEILSTDELFVFENHIQRCEKCRNEFELEKSTKSYFKGKVGLLSPPDDLFDAILSRLSAEDALIINRERRRRLSFHILLWPALAIAMVLIFVVTNLQMKKQSAAVQESVQKPSITAEPRTRDALALADRNFQDLLTGKLVPQMKAKDTRDMTTFLKQKAGYSIQLPSLSNPDWIGGSVTTSDGEKVVSVAYKAGTSYVSIYAFPTALAHSNAVTLPQECISALDGDHWYWARSSNGNLQVAWMDGGRVCVATSNLDRKDLAACLNARKDDD